MLKLLEKLPMRGGLFVLVCAVVLGCAEEDLRGPFERAEEKAWKVVNRNQRGRDGLYVQATWRTFAYEIIEAYSRAERQGLDQDQLESRLRERIYTYVSSEYPASDGTDINNLYLQYLIYINPSFDASNPLQKSVFDAFRDEYIKRLLLKVYDRKYSFLRQNYDERWGLTLYSRLVFYIYVDNKKSELKPRIDDIGVRTFLVDDQGQRYAPSGLAGPYPYEYDQPKQKRLEGQLVYRVFFPNRKADHQTPIVTPESRYVQLEIENLGEEPVRRLRWDLPLEFPEVAERSLPGPARP